MKIEKADYGFDMMVDDMTIAIWLTIPPERMQELCPGKIFFILTTD